MRKNLVVALSLAAIAAASTSAFADYSAAGSGVSGSRHDINKFASENAGLSVTPDSQERVCAFCHTPHHAYAKDMTGASSTGTTADYLPLWSHELTAKAYTPYASSTLQASIGDPLIGPSRLCMSCHDGVIAVDTHYQNLGAEATKSPQLTGDTFSSTAALSGAVGAGTSLAGDHPIGFDYLVAQAADRDANTNLVTGIKEASNHFLTINGSGQIPTTIQDVLFPFGSNIKRIMTCSTCHEVHNRDNVVQYKANGSRMDVNYFLYGSQSGSKICLSCHDK